MSNETRDMEFATTWEAAVYKSSRLVAASPLFQHFSRFPLPWFMVVFPRWLMGVFRYLDFLSPLMMETNSSFVRAS